MLEGGSWGGCFFPGSQLSFFQSLAGNVPTPAFTGMESVCKGGETIVPRSEGTITTGTGCLKRLSGGVGVARQRGERRGEDR